MASIIRLGQIFGTGSPNYLDNIIDCVVRGNYAYVVSLIDDAFVIIDISNKSAPAKVGSLTGSGNYLNGAIGIDVDEDSNYAYVASKYSSAFVIIDISNKSAPAVVGQVTGAENYLDDAQDVKVHGNYAYVTGEVSDSLVIIDISNKSAPVRVGHLTGSSNYLNSPRGLDISSNGDYAFVTSDVQESLAIINCTNKTSPYLESNIHTGIGSTYDVIVSDTYAYIAVNTTNDFAIINITNKSSPSLVVAYSSASLSDCNGIYIDDNENYAFIASSANNRVAVLDITTKSSPSILTSITGSGEYLANVFSVFYDGNYVYACGRNSDAFVILQFTPDAPGIPTNISCISDVQKNTISWDSVTGADYYNLYWMKYEFFVDEFTSLDLWDQYKDVGTETIEINSNKLRFSNSSGTGCHVVNKNEIPSGDFDIEIELSTYTPDDNSNGHKSILKIIDSYPFTNVDGAEIYYYVSNSGTTHNIVSNIYINSVLYNIATTSTNQPTKLRITRVGDIITTYYYDSSWILVDNRDFSSHSSNIILATLDTLQTSGNGGLTEFDNFNYYVDVKTLGTKIAAIDALSYEHISLDVLENYIYIVTSENLGGESSSSNIVNGIPLTETLGKPILIGENGDSQNIITIDNTTGAVSIDIYYSLIPDVTKINGIKIENVTNPYYHIDLIRQNYYYIAILNAVGVESDPSDELCLKPDFEGKIFDHTDQIKISLLYQYKDKD